MRLNMYCVSDKSIYQWLLGAERIMDGHWTEQDKIIVRNDQNDIQKAFPHKMCCVKIVILNADNFLITQFTLNTF